MEASATNVAVSSIGTKVLRKIKKKTMRKLVIQNKQSKLWYMKNICWIISLGLLCLTLSFYYLSFVWTDFLIHYRQQYNQVMYGNPDYCNPNLLNNKSMFDLIKSEIINQNDALIEFQNIFLLSSDPIKSIVIAGPSGVGKTFLVSHIQRNFPWQSQFKYMKWSTFGNDKIKILKIKRYIRRISDCGQNLLIIDNLSLGNLDVIKIINELIEKILNLTKSKLLIVMYIFNLPSFSINGEKSYENNLQYFKSHIDSQIQPIIFRKFNSNDLELCILKEFQELNINLSEIKMEELRKSIDVHRFGCKNVQAKVLLYKKPDIL